MAAVRIFPHTNHVRNATRRGEREKFMAQIPPARMGLAFSSGNLRLLKQSDLLENKRHINGARKDMVENNLSRLSLYCGALQSARRSSSMRFVMLARGRYAFESLTNGVLLDLISARAHMSIVLFRVLVTRTVLQIARLWKFLETVSRRQRCSPLA